MSRDGGFLGRWSRLKRSEAKPEAPAEPHESLAEEGAAAPEAPEPQPVIAPEDLPNIEDMTADSDISAFLQKGVPKALKAAALRRAWSLDPAIRDYVGPAEYAWDFNDPASIPGFGGASTPGEISRALRSLMETAKTPEPEPPAGAVPPGGESPAAPSPDAARADGAVEETAAAEGMTPAHAEDESVALNSSTPPDAVEPGARATGRRHGGAIPK